MPIDIFSTEIMHGVVERLPNQSAFFKRTFFGNDKPEIGTKIRVEFKKGARKVAPFVTVKDKAGIVQKRGFSTEDFETPLVKMKDVTTVEDLLTRRAGELIHAGIKPEQRAIEQLTETMVDFDEYITRREELMCVQALFDGKLEIKGENVDYDIDFGFSNKIVLTEKWDVSTKADPLKDLSDMVLACRKNGLVNPNVVVMERSAFYAFQKRCMELGYFDQRNFLNVEIAPSIKDEGVVYMGTLRDPKLEIYVYDEWYIDPIDDEQKSMLPKGKILVASTKMKTTMFYGENTVMDDETKKFKTVVGRRCSKTWVENDPDARFVQLQSRPLPVPHEVDSWCVATVSATEE